MSTTDSQVQLIVNSLTDIKTPVTQEEIPFIVVSVLAATASLPSMSTSDKNKLIIDVISYYISKSNMPPSEQLLILNLVPGMITTIENASKSTSLSCSSCFPSCFSSSCCKKPS